MQTPSRAAGFPINPRPHGKAYLRTAWLREIAQEGGGVPPVAVGYVTDAGDLVIWDTTGEVYSAKERS